MTVAGPAGGGGAESAPAGPATVAAPASSEAVGARITTPFGFASSDRCPFCNLGLPSHPGASLPTRYSLSDLIYPVAAPLALALSVGTVFFMDAMGRSPENKEGRKIASPTEFAVSPDSSSRDSGADGDFISIIVPLQERAIEIAEIEARFGRNPQLRRLAEEMVVARKAEMKSLELAVTADLLQLPRSRGQ